MSSIISVHPHIKKIIQTLDLDLGSELTKFEQSLYQDSILIPDIVSDIPPKQDLSSSSLIYYPDSIAQRGFSIESDEPISVASRLLDAPNVEEKSLLDFILTPWGIMGILIFCGANLFIFINQDTKIAVNNNNENPQNISETNPSIPENNQNNIVELNSLNPTENNPPPLPLPLPDTNNSVENQSPHPNLKTALLKEITKPSPSENNPPPLTINSPNSSVTSPSSPSKNTKYYLVTNYENMDNFNKIKNIIPNALILNVEKEIKIQLGIFATETEAKIQSQKLQSQGIITQIIPQPQP
ncbi:hypothetical protein [Geminocystis herdmanii]|uniref:hypothetical protein n=1 Tax=Geminocystis herdmanii TaxID=669359 RepID=UPI00034657C4|nr:hypothetical protein [Geminocystis herdmanii]